MLLLIDAESVFGTIPPLADEPTLPDDDDGTLVPPLLRFGLDRVLAISTLSWVRGNPLFMRLRRSCSANAAAAPIAIAEAIVIPAIPPGSNPGLIANGTAPISVTAPLVSPPGCSVGLSGGGVPSSNILRSLPDEPPPPPA